MKHFIPLFFLIIVVSCSKDNKPDTKENSCNRIVEVLDYHPYEIPVYQTTAKLTYDTEGRIKTVIGQGQNKSEYTYFTDSIVVKATDIYGVDIGQVYYLDNLHRISAIKNANKEFQYNADSYLVSFKQAFGDNGQIYGYIQYFLKWENENLAEIYTDDPFVSTKKVTFSYYNLPNQNLLGYNSPFYVGGIVRDRNSVFLLKGSYFGNQSKQLLNTLSFNGAGLSDNAIYQPDSNGRFITIGEYYKFIYQCP